jgi:hypothetical protein
MWRIVVLLWLAIAAACSRPAPSRPIDRLATAIEKHDYLAAYDLMPQEFRWVYSRTDFVRMMGGEVVTPALPSSSPPPPPRDTLTNSTPREALRSFVRAWEHKRWSTIITLIPSKYRTLVNEDKVREQLEQPEQQAMLELLVDSLNAPIDEHDDRATMPYGNKYEVVFILESDGWKIEDLD